MNSKVDTSVTKTNTLEADELPQFRRWLRELLKNGIVEVSFVKADGTDRVMLCTLDPQKIPAAPLTESATKTRKENADVLAVWDTENGAWKSFRLDRVTQVRASLVNGDVERKNDEQD